MPALTRICWYFVSYEKPVLDDELNLTLWQTRNPVDCSEIRQIVVKSGGFEWNTADCNQIYNEIHSEIHNESHCEIHNEIYTKMHYEIHNEICNEIHSETHARSLAS